MAMPRNYPTFGDIEGKLDVLRVECTKCPRKGRYSVARLIEKYGRKANMMKWKEQLNGDCPKRDAHQLQERCDLNLPAPAQGVYKVIMAKKPAITMHTWAISASKGRQRSKSGGLMHLMPRPRSRKRSSATASQIASSRSGSRRAK